MSSLEQLYQQVILDHSRERHGAGAIPSGIGAASHQVNPTCGDEVTLGVSVADGRITDLVWDGDGCSISQASLSMLSDLVDGRSTDEVARLYADMDQMMHSRGRGVPEETLDGLGDAAALEGTSQFPNRIKCALLGWYALRDALAKLGTDIAGGTRS
ncbi:MAG: SUF system NifU family Fe-S cluster assembly protein [Actinomyces sp.]|jgi:nitrogen fixation NifU-like protein|nr:SUF system NifU family Fe-S cluster assembly protein [Actinomyces sp.]MCI1662876.1 SUF system NifU family Fe-S cluster assembly protein [Actinomyces sp.]MCI1691437.1 SUF system NifU family Fe-S cluster assembly protein [Actinomyces sp.]MCI1788880.1 SUF system NifU family Fe-S cluster assembly protein [Actinomyces sp.]MCI1830666.1 SUF system NifU family Fe-S cluster assembly protein [Actinomyces sp.]